MSLGNLNPILSDDGNDSIIDIFSYSLLIEIIISIEGSALYFNRLAILSQMNQLSLLLFKVFIVNRPEFINLILKSFHFL